MDILRLDTVAMLLAHPEPAVRREAVNELGRRMLRWAAETCAGCVRLAEARRAS